MHGGCNHGCTHAFQEGGREERLSFKTLPPSKLDESRATLAPYEIGQVTPPDDCGNPAGALAPETGVRRSGPRPPEQSSCDVGP